MLMRRDIRAFVHGDWSSLEGDFAASRFFAVDAGGHASPSGWSLRLVELSAYREEWLRQARRAAETEYAEDLEAALHRCSRLERIEIQGDRALVVKVFDGELRLRSGGVERLDWQSVYHCVREAGRWQIAGFTGYLPRSP